VDPVDLEFDDDSVHVAGVVASHVFVRELIDVFDGAIGRHLHYMRDDAELAVRVLRVEDIESSAGIAFEVVRPAPMLGAVHNDSIFSVDVDPGGHGARTAVFAERGDGDEVLPLEQRALLRS
jgi:hypothetical protein